MFDYKTWPHSGGKIGGRIIKHPND